MCVDRNEINMNPVFIQQQIRRGRKVKKKIFIKEAVGEGAAIVEIEDIFVEIKGGRGNRKWLVTVFAFFV